MVKTAAPKSIPEYERYLDEQDARVVIGVDWAFKEPPKPPRERQEIVEEAEALWKELDERAGRYALAFVGLLSEVDPTKATDMLRFAIGARVHAQGVRDALRAMRGVYAEDAQRLLDAVRPSPDAAKVDELVESSLVNLRRLLMFGPKNNFMTAATATASSSGGMFADHVRRLAAAAEQARIDQVHKAAFEAAGGDESGEWEGAPSPTFEALRRKWAEQERTDKLEREFGATCIGTLHFSGNASPIFEPRIDQVRL